MIETSRLLIRNFIEDDIAGCYHNFGKDESIGQYIVLFPMQNFRDMECFIRTLIPNPNAWIIIEKDTNEPMGYVTVDIPYQQLGIGEIGYVLGERFQKKGYALEAVSGILNEYLVNRELYMIEAKYNEHNFASANLLKKLCFREDGRLRDRRINLKTGERNHLVICSVTREEYLSGMR